MLGVNRPDKCGEAGIKCKPKARLTRVAKLSLQKIQCVSRLGRSGHIISEDPSLPPKEIFLFGVKKAIIMMMAGEQSRWRVARNQT